MLRFFNLTVLLLAATSQAEPLSLRQSCVNALKDYKSYFKEEVLEQVCERAQKNADCASVLGEPIFHADFTGVSAKPKKIMVLSLIHGDETHAGNVGRFWMERLHKLDARNSWRIIPVANPDGVKLKTRTNSEGVDLNRNFPTIDWTAEAQNFWKNRSQASPRKFPGYAAGKEPEVRCIMQHLDEYKPDFVISIHTPLKVLDFDGPKVKPPKYSYLPWRSLGNFPGSLGRYLWVERQVPVLTTELRHDLPVNSIPFEQLQDLVGTLVQKDLK
ncbi:MAG: murein peptide amidase A [Bdellovibrionales bacterium RIFCSPHIGHO2_01_FULL_40_29]|nr:MAG: murein peptide amidase A [Bdellovibrionales bacterium RIFCSPHIGHO2_01_FULL_40_29]OFZ35353.1 MAG: murein peptide amidase A [Bdellovibrionales bacterium RIFCSPHIGHO2_02_FULL_40_15]